MARNWRNFDCPAEAVFEVLSDGWLYPSWVVGASRMRRVDTSWPAVGSKLHHSVGTWPLLLNDSTSVHEWSPPHRTVLRARGWPVGEASVTIAVEARGERCVVKMLEFAVKGPARFVPRVLADPIMAIRNRETLRRLAYLAEGRYHSGERR